MEEKRRAMQEQSRGIEERRRRRSERVTLALTGHAPASREGMQEARV